MHQRPGNRRWPLIKENRSPVFIVKLTAIHNPSLAVKFNVCDDVSSRVYVERHFILIFDLMRQKPVKDRFIEWDMIIGEGLFNYSPDAVSLFGCVSP